MKILSKEINGQDPHEAGMALLQTLYGGPLPEIRRTEMGKPYFPGKDTHFSISHTKRRVFCAVSSRPIGIDGEELDRDISLALAEKILSAGELAQFRAASDKKRALLTFWVLKEAYAKCTGEGLRIWPNHTEFSLTDPRVREIDGCLVAVIEKENNDAI